jgi:hypothetical protein
VSDDFEKLLDRLDSDDEHVRRGALDELGLIFREQHPSRAELRERMRAWLDRWDADDVTAVLDAIPGAHERMQKGRQAAKEGHVTPLEELDSPGRVDSAAIGFRPNRAEAASVLP